MLSKILEQHWKNPTDFTIRIVHQYYKESRELNRRLKRDDFLSYDEAKKYILEHMDKYGITSLRVDSHGHPSLKKSKTLKKLVKDGVFEVVDLGKRRYFTAGEWYPSATGYLAITSRELRLVNPPSNKS